MPILSGNIVTMVERNLSMKINNYNVVLHGIIFERNAVIYRHKYDVQDNFQKN